MSYFLQISLGTVTNTEEAVRWMSYTYLFVRMRKNPLVYGIPHTFREVSPLLPLPVFFHWHKSCDIHHLKIQKLKKFKLWLNNNYSTSNLPSDQSYKIKYKKFFTNN